jgi:hypothetical protein
LANTENLDMLAFQWKASSLQPQLPVCLINTMLTQEASDDRKWNGLRLLRSLLQEDAKRIESSLHPFLSTEEGRFEYAHKVLYLAAIVEALRKHLLNAIALSEPPEVRQKVAMKAVAELESLIGELRAVQQMASDASQQINQLCSEVSKAAWM